MPKANTRKSRTAGMKNSPLKNSPLKNSPLKNSPLKTSSKIKSNGKSLMSPKKSGGSGCRHSKRLQQQKITESWAGTVHETRIRSNDKKTGKPNVDNIITTNIHTDGKEKSKNLIADSEMKLSPSNKTTSAPRMILPLDGLNRGDKLQILKNFDLEGLYGPCRGISRRSRFERALNFNLNPVPQEIILEILESHPNDPEFERCIWDCNDLLRVKLGSPTKKGQGP